MMYWNTLKKILYLKGYKWLSSQNQGVRNYFFGYRQYEALAKHIKSSFFKKNFKVNGRQCPDYKTFFTGIC